MDAKVDKFLEACCNQTTPPRGMDAAELLLNLLVRSVSTELGICHLIFAYIFLIPGQDLMLCGGKFFYRIAGLSYSRTALWQYRLVQVRSVERRELRKIENGYSSTPVDVIVEQDAEGESKDVKFPVLCDQPEKEITATSRRYAELDLEKELNEKALLNGNQLREYEHSRAASQQRGWGTKYYRHTQRRAAFYQYDPNCQYYSTCSLAADD